MSEIADVWFDPSCPYTWITTRWLLEAAEVRPVTPRWHLLSLAALNEGRDDDPENDPEGYLWLPARVCAAVTAEAGQAALGRFYTAFGTRVHERGEMGVRTIADALGERRAPTSRLRHVAHIGVRTRDFAFRNRGLEPPVEEFRVALRGPDGDEWTWGPPDARQSVTGPALDFCQAVTQRRHRADLALAATGPDADRWLDVAQAFAGPPGTGRAPSRA
ncbi:hypothetical protein GCM10023178_19890 [Actinomadura luteofluorescens]